VTDVVDEEATLAHYGTPRHSGRYPWGSGEDPYQNATSFMAAYNELKKKGLTEAAIAKGLGFDSTSDLRARISISSNDIRSNKIRELQKLLDKGMSMSAATRQMGIPEASGRALMDPVLQERAQRLRVTADILKKNVDEYTYVDVGKGTENHMGISDTQLKTAIAILKTEGYRVGFTNVQQVGTGLNTSLKVLVPENITNSDIFHNKDKIHAITEYIDPDTGKQAEDLGPIVPISPKRVGVLYGPDGGAKADGVMYLRPGVPDISLGNSRYAQVRVQIGTGDDIHYIKGMAMYKDDLPAGVDILFNTNKKDTGNKLDALKAPDEKKATADNPFGAITRPKAYVDPKTGETKRSILNIVNEEGDWYTWSNTFSSQFLSKQTPQLAKSQLELTQKSKEADLSEILSLTNPAVKRKLLETFADEADSSSVKLKATGLPRTASHVILPINSLKDNEIYAPKYNDGEVVTLVRHPHGGIFEIPTLIVNNSNKEAQRSIKGAKDAVGINAKVAERLSGADFDGDAVLVIPNNNGRVKTSSALLALKNFDPKELYTLPKDSLKGLKGAKNPGGLKQQLMGDVSNLITDMTIKGAHQEEIARAVKHSMVVIDAEKHNLDYKQSAIDNNINELKRKYQGSAKSGASTLISRTTSVERVPLRKNRPAAEGGAIDKSTGERVYVPTGESYVDKKGKLVIKMFKSTKGAEAKDAHTLSSGTVIENIYADHSNALKALANKARLESTKIQNIPYSQSAKVAYSNEVKSLNAKLNVAEMNAPKERQAQLIARAIVNAKVESNPGMDKADLKKVQGLALTEARARAGAGKIKIDITPNEWAAIQSGALSASRLKKIVDNTDVELLRELATPRNKPIMNNANIALAQSMLASGYTAAEVASRLGVSTSTLYGALQSK
jgi:hypothetical protein